jgi:hypothetical protein
MFEITSEHLSDPNMMWQALEHNKNLRQLDLAQNPKIGDEGGEALAIFLHAHPQIWHLALQDCNVRRSGTEKLRLLAYHRLGVAESLEEEHRRKRDRDRMSRKNEDLSSLLSEMDATKSTVDENSSSIYGDDEDSRRQDMSKTEQKNDLPRVSEEFSLLSCSSSAWKQQSMRSRLRSLTLFVMSENQAEDEECAYCYSQVQIHANCAIDFIMILLLFLCFLPR